MNLGLEFLYIKSIVVSVDGGSVYVEFTFLQEYLFLMVDILLDVFSRYALGNLFYIAT